MKNKIFINLSEIASEVITFIKTRPPNFPEKKSGRYRKFSSN